MVPLTLPVSALPVVQVARSFFSPDLSSNIASVFPLVLFDLTFWVLPERVHVSVTLPIMVLHLIAHPGAPELLPLMS